VRRLFHGCLQPGAPAATRIDYLSRQGAWMLVKHVIRADRLKHQQLRLRA
jgi:hypothetical protein